MMKLNTLVLLVLCGVAANQASALGLGVPVRRGSCPDILKTIVLECGSDTLLSVSIPLDCSSPALKCLADNVLNELGLSANTTHFDSQDLVDVLVDVGVHVSFINTCTTKVAGLADEVYGPDCDLALLGELVLCLLQKLKCPLSLTV